MPEATELSAEPLKAMIDVQAERIVVVHDPEGAFAVRRTASKDNPEALQGFELVMCGRVIQKSGPLRLAIVEGLDVSDSRVANVRPSYNAAPRQELLVIRQNHKTGERSTAHLTPPPSISVAIGVFTLAI